MKVVDMVLAKLYQSMEMSKRLVRRNHKETVEIITIVGIFLKLARAVVIKSTVFLFDNSEKFLYPPLTQEKNNMSFEKRGINKS